jgi:hypothetical protein
MIISFINCINGLLRMTRNIINIINSMVVYSVQMNIPNDNEASYAILDPNETGFDRSNKTDESTPPGTYTILDPSVTGFNRSNDDSCQHYDG